MKKIIALFMVVVFALSLCACVDDSTKKDIISHADKNQTIATKPKTETPAQKATEAPTEKATEAPTEKPTEAKKEETKAPDSFTSDDLVMTDVTGRWSHVKTNGHHGLEITHQDKNTITMTITAIRGQAAQIATAEVTVNMVVDAAGGQWSDTLGGKGTFYYEDSFLNQGRGEIIVYGPDSLTLNLYQTGDTNGGWCVAAAAGDYTRR